VARFDLYLKQKDSRDYAELKGDFRLLERDAYQFNLDYSTLMLLGEEWHNSDNFSVSIKGREIAFQNVYLGSKDRFIKAEGKISENPDDVFNASLANINLEIFSNLIGKKLTGIANGDMMLQNAYHDIRIDGKLNADAITLDNFLIGDLRSSATWERQEKRMAISAGIQRDALKLIDISGYYKPDARNQLNLEATLSEADINMLEPFLSEIASNFAGKASGKIKIRGTPAYPTLRGEIMVRGGRFRVNYLNTTYFFDDIIYLYEDQIGMKRLRLRDDAGNIAFLDGGIYHDSFREFIMQLSAEFRRFKVLDTPLSPDALYYGVAIATGTFSVFGPASNMRFNIDARNPYLSSSGWLRQHAGTKLYPFCRSP
jgi:autotransporter translocation and assembly factor TamB